MIQERRGMLKRWNLTLVVATFLLTIFGTFLTRSGVIASVHSFTQSPVGWYFLAFLVVAGIFAYTLLHTRWPELAPDSELESMLSREAAFLFNNLLLVGIAFSVLWGTMFPILSELLQGTKLTVGPPFFNRVNVPLGLLLLALTGIGPLIAWRRASRANLKRQFTVPLGMGLLALVASLVAGIRELYPVVTVALTAFVGAAIVQEFGRGVRARMRMYSDSITTALVRLVGRNRRRYGGYIVHVGILCYCVAFAGMAFRTDLEATLKPGESISLASPFGHAWTFTHTGVSQYKDANRYVSQAAVRLEREGEDLGLLTSEKRQHFTLEDGVEVKSFEASTEVGLRSNLREDVYVVFEGVVNGTEEAQYRFTINPLVWWVWFGGLVLVVGGLITMWPGGGGPLAPTRKLIAAGAEPAGARVHA
jgi:cytochrome c-type biogenesis protein CcmF